jgi:hypothetical protein
VKTLTSSLALLTSLLMAAVVGVARVFRRGDFPSHWQPPRRAASADWSKRVGNLQFAAIKYQRPIIFQLRDLE